MASLQGQDSTVAKVTIPNGATTSGAVNTRFYLLAGIEMPAAFTGATISFEASRSEGGTFKGVVDQAGAAITVTATADKMIGLDAAAGELAPWQWVRLVSASAEGAEREIWLHLKA